MTPSHGIRFIMPRRYRNGLSLVPFKIGTRLGVDLNMIDLTDEAELSWLNALIWREHYTRRQMLDAAMQDVNFDKVTLIEGGWRNILA